MTRFGSVIWGIYSYYVIYPIDIVPPPTFAHLDFPQGRLPLLYFTLYMYKNDIPPL